MQGENALHPLSLYNPTNGESLPDTIMLSSDDIPFEYLNTLLWTIQNTLMDFHPITDAKIGDVCLHVLLLDMAEQCVDHGFLSL
jgi:hypothetical protein